MPGPGVSAPGSFSELALKHCSASHCPLSHLGAWGSPVKLEPWPLPPPTAEQQPLWGRGERYSSEPDFQASETWKHLTVAGRGWLSGWPWLSVCLSGHGWLVVTARPQESSRGRRDFQNQTGNWLLGLVAEATALGDHGMGLELG